MTKSKILIVEDDADLREVLTLLLSANYHVVTASDGVTGLKAALRDPPDLILLDLKMPHMDGYQTCGLIRADNEFKSTPIIVMSGYGGENELSRALEAGATQFISKPFDSEDLIERVDNQLQKQEKRVQSGVSYLQAGNLKIEPTQGKVMMEDREIHFSQLEFKLLALLVEKAGALVSREEILKDVWNQQAASPRVIDPHIVSIRDKLGGGAVTISSVYGKGYILKSS